MEPISAARAMQWSVELERGLRSKIPGKPIEAILAIGPKLQKWSEEASLTATTSNMFGLVPGEDRMFANSILLRLADAFKSGNNYTRVSVLKVFLLELRHRKKKGKHYKGILEKQRVPNHLELLKRVKIVFDTGDVESRALALRLLGCLADLGKDSLEIRYMILSTLKSCHSLEVKASLFAAGCFCELSDDFALVVLMILVNLVTSLKTSFDVKVAAVRVFGKIGCSSSIASIAYKTCKKLVVDSLNEDIVTEMLLSLSKLAFKLMLVISEQVDLLLSFLTCESLPSVHTTALRCLGFLFSKGICFIPINRNLLTTMLNILERANLPLNLQSEAFSILRKVFHLIQLDLAELASRIALVFCCTLLGPARMDITELGNTISSVENFARSPIVLRKHMALGLLVDISCSLKKLGDHCCDLSHHPSQDNSQDVAFLPCESSAASLPWRVIQLIIDQIDLLVTSTSSETENGDATLKPGNSIYSVKQECHRLLNLIFLLVREYHVLGTVALDRIKCSIEVLVKTWKSFNINHASTCGMDIDTGNSDGHLELSRKEQINIVSELILSLCRFSGACLTILDEAGFVNHQVYDTAKMLVELVLRSGFFNHCMCMIFSFFLSSCLMVHSWENDNNIPKCRDKDLPETEVVPKFHVDCWIIHGKQILEFVDKIITEKEFWVAYRVGKYAACQGAWFAAKHTFGLLLDRVQSDFCHYWLKSLAQLSDAENEIQLLLLLKQGIWITDGPQLNEDQSSERNTDLGEYGEKIAGAYNKVCSSEKILAMAVTLDQNFYFQRWVLDLRARVLEVVADILGLLHYSTSNKGKIEDVMVVERDFGISIQNMQFFIYHFTQISFRLEILSKEFDLLAVSFMDIDQRSLKCISRLALDCSLLAFCTAFVIHFPSLPDQGTSIMASLENSWKFSRAMVVQDLIERLWHLDGKISRDLQLFLTVFGEINGFSQSRTRISSHGYRERATLMVCRFAVPGVLRLQEEAKDSNDEMDRGRLCGAGLKLLANIVMRWVYIPSQMTPYFFKVRSCIGAELFASNADNRNSDGIFVPLGFHLSLNLCIQLKNLPNKCNLRELKIYCILAVHPSDRLHDGNGGIKGGERLGFRPRKTKEMVDLNEELLKNMSGIKETGKRQEVSNNGLVKSFVCFESSEGRQGFSTCLLDVSSFHEGSYQIMWKSCCIDNKGSCWSLVSLNSGPVFSIKHPLDPI